MFYPGQGQVIHQLLAEFWQIGRVKRAAKRFGSVSLVSVKSDKSAYSTHNRAVIFGESFQRGYYVAFGIRKFILIAQVAQGHVKFFRWFSAWNRQGKFFG